MPSPAEIEVDECAAPKQSYSLSARLVNPDSPPPCRSVRIWSRRDGQYLVRIGLMAYIPDQPVARRVEYVVQCHGQFDNAEAGPEVTAGHRHSTDRFGPQFVGHLPELPLVQVPQIGGSFDGVEKRSWSWS